MFARIDIDEKRGMSGVGKARRDWLVRPNGNFALSIRSSKHAKYQHRCLCPADLPRHWSSKINMRTTQEISRELKKPDETGRKWTDGERE